MRLTHADGRTQHLSYCSNIHPGESWAEVQANLVEHLPAIRALMPGVDELGIGLRLSAAATTQLSDPAMLARFKDFLSKERFYVFTINAFPYGPFHGTRVKEDVYLPDWLDTERLRYTNQVATILSALLPANCHGSISTVPGAFKSSVRSQSDVEQMARLMVAHVAHLIAIEQSTGKHIVLALEPEPCCFLETIEESVEFFTNALFSEASVLQLCDATGLSCDDALSRLKTHLTLCLDLCHAAVEFEDHEACMLSLRQADIRIGKLQISAGLRLNRVDEGTRSLLQPFDDDVYLHQVVQREGSKLTRFKDLGDAFDSLELNSANSRQTSSVEENHEIEWRVHFHVPIFLDNLGSFSSTQDFVERALADHRCHSISEHLEVETYTWSVLPDALKTLSITEAIARELDWVRSRL